MDHSAHLQHNIQTDSPVIAHSNHMHMASGSEHGSMGHMMSMAVRQQTSKNDQII